MGKYLDYSSGSSLENLRGKSVHVNWANIVLSISEEGLAIVVLCYVVAAAVVINHRLVIIILQSKYLYFIFCEWRK